MAAIKILLAQIQAFIALKNEPNFVRFCAMGLIKNNIAFMQLKG